MRRLVVRTMALYSAERGRTLTQEKALCIGEFISLKVREKPPATKHKQEHAADSDADAVAALSISQGAGNKRRQCHSCVDPHFLSAEGCCCCSRR